ncbi:TrkA family potassium uptake protein [cf. Phormidesmis sp. LEGE 11477]|uniref:potassium channel family protein n=1 Tax=cf. Phormidesmis sp. LEGE 11477 TaxID=1828680 RepID=UPI00188190DB|nr:potassium channel protein [cf. Phormidesmis sp. LEGE 11477]MBE9059855.1 potassium channel protein [cf. Phormidesmis sp. LEGE 11477]
MPRPPFIREPKARDRYYTALQERYRKTQRELFRGLLALVGIILAGTLWYWLVEGWHLAEALYMTVITLTTVGFSEVRPLGDRGRVFTTVLIFLGIAAVGYMANRFTEAIVKGYFQEGVRLNQRRKLMQNLSNHYILCGFGRTGRQIAEEFSLQKIPFVIVDTEADRVEQAQTLGFVAVQGDATSDHTLHLVKIESAVCLISALTSDAENLYTVLSARTLNPRVRIIARASSSEAIQKLRRVGADAVISPYITGGKRMAAAALRPQVMDFMDGIVSSGDRTYYMEEFFLDSSACAQIGQTLKESQLRALTGVLIVAIRRDQGELIVGPTSDIRLQPKDFLICLGTAEQLQVMNRLLCPLSSKPLQKPNQMP